MQEAKSEIDKILVELVAKKANFEEIAQRKSEDTETKSHGGRIGWIKAGQMPLEFENAAWQLDICEMSSPVHTKHGWHLILRRG